MELMERVREIGRAPRPLSDDGIGAARTRAAARDRRGRSERMPRPPAPHRPLDRRLGAGRRARGDGAGDRASSRCPPRRRQPRPRRRCWRSAAAASIRPPRRSCRPAATRGSSTAFTSLTTYDEQMPAGAKFNNAFRAEADAVILIEDESSVVRARGPRGRVGARAESAPRGRTRSVRGPRRPLKRGGVSRIPEQDWPASRGTRRRRRGRSRRRRGDLLPGRPGDLRRHAHGSRRGGRVVRGTVRRRGRVRRHGALLHRDARRPDVVQPRPGRRRAPECSERSRRCPVWNRRHRRRSDHARVRAGTSKRARPGVEFVLDTARGYVLQSTNWGMGEYDEPVVFEGVPDWQSRTVSTVSIVGSAP